MCDREQNKKHAQQGGDKTNKGGVMKVIVLGLPGCERGLGGYDEYDYRSMTVCDSNEVRKRI